MNPQVGVLSYPEALEKALSALRDLCEAAVADARAAIFAEASMALQMIQEAADFDEVHSEG